MGWGAGGTRSSITSAAGLIVGVALASSTDVLGLGGLEQASIYPAALLPGRMESVWPATVNDVSIDLWFRGIDTHTSRSTYGCSLVPKYTREFAPPIDQQKEKREGEICKANQSKVDAVALQNLLEGRQIRPGRRELITLPFPAIT
jgi:hypothetical protein